MEQVLFLYPIFTLVFLHFTIMFLMGYRRFKAMAKGEIKPGVFKLYKDSDMSVTPEKVQLASRNYINLFEMPVLFYALIPLLFYFELLDMLTLVLMWVFVLARCFHSYIHVTSNKLVYRMRLFFLSALVLLFMWLRFFVQVTFTD